MGGNNHVAGICGVDRERRISSLVAWRYMARLFARVTRAGAASGRPYGKIHLVASRAIVGRGKFDERDGNQSCFVGYQTRRGL